MRLGKPIILSKHKTLPSAHARKKTTLRLARASIGSLTVRKGKKSYDLRVRPIIGK